MNLKGIKSMLIKVYFKILLNNFIRTTFIIKIYFNEFKDNKTYVN